MSQTQKYQQSLISIIIYSDAFQSAWRHLKNNSVLPGWDTIYFSLQSKHDLVVLILPTISEPLRAQTYDILAL